MSAISTINWAFLKNTGETGAIIENKDWSQSPLGPISQWPELLKNSLNVLLHSQFPMFLMWGQELYCFYNDAYRLSLGVIGKHPSIIGQPARDAYPETFPTMKKELEGMMQGEKGSWHENISIPVYRDNGIEESFWTLSNSPVIDDEGNVAGIFVTCFETTRQKNALEKIAFLEASTRMALDAALMGTFDRDLVKNTLHLSEKFREIFAFEKKEITADDVINRIHPEDRHLRVKGHEEALKTGFLFYEVRLVWPDSTIHWVDVRGRYFFNPNGEPIRYIGTISESTHKKNFIDRLEASEKKFRNTVQQSPSGITIFRGDDFIVEMVNDAYLEVIDKKEEEIVGKKLFDIIPETREFVEPLLKKVLESGEPYYGFEFKVPLRRYGKTETTYFNFVYQPLRENSGTISGVMVVATEVTQQVEAKHLLQENEKVFRSIVDQSPISICILKGEDFVIDMANQQMIKKLWRKNPEEVIGKRILEVFPELLEQKYPELLHKVYHDLVSHREKEALAYVQGNDGLKAFYLDFEYIPLIEKEGKASGIMINVYDVTEKVEIRNAIQKAEEKFRSLANTLPQLIWTTDADGFLNYCNDAVSDYTGSTKEDIYKSGWANIVHPDEREKNIEAWLECVRTGNPYNYEHRFRRYDGTYRWQLSRGLAQKDSNGNIVLWVGSSTDIDDIKRHEQQKDDFIKMASHELKTPVTSIKGYVQLLLQMTEQKENEIIHSSLEVIDKQVSKLTQLITDLLDLTRIETGTLLIHKQTASINEIVKNVVRDMQQTTAQHIIEIKENAFVNTMADAAKISQVLGNYIGNAIKYSPEANKIIVEINHKENDVIISVQDFGIGIPVEDQAKVFERFFRVHGKAEDTYPGFGIGLFIVNEIILLHNGQTWLSSKKNEGSTFYFSLPL